MTFAGERRGPWGRRTRSAGAACLTLLVLLLPALFAGRGLAAPAAAGEIERLERALPGHAGPLRDTSIARAFHGALVLTTHAADDELGRASLLGRARLAQLVGLLAVGLVLYLVVLMARGRLHALCACAAFAVLPPVFEAGHVLRAETAATGFVLGALLLFVAASHAALRRGRARRGPDRLQRPLLFGCAAVANGLAVATVPWIGECLLLPAFVLVLGSLQILLRGARALRRRGLEGLPVRSLNARLLPWTLSTLLSPAAAAVLLSASAPVPVGELAAPPPLAPLFPPSAVGFGAIGALAALGAVVGLLRVGMAFGRGGRIGPDLLLLAFCAVFLAAHARGLGSDEALPATPALAVLVADGVVAGLVFVLRRR